jgi:hypothetical protein
MHRTIGAYRLRAVVIAVADQKSSSWAIHRRLEDDPIPTRFGESLVESLTSASLGRVGRMLLSPSGSLSP